MNSIKFLIILFLISLLSPLLANDDPILVKMNGKTYFPAFKTYSEVEFGGQMETKVNFKDEYMQKLLRKNNAFVIYPLISYDQHSMDYQHTASHPSKPSRDHFLGTDDQGRDVLARSLYCLRTSMLFALAFTIITSIIGIIIGAMQGYFGGKFDILTQRFIEIWNSLPNLFIIIIISSIFEQGFLSLLAIMTLFGWTNLVNLVRAEFLKIRNMDYVLAAKISGAKNMRIMFKYILPNALSSTISTIPFIFAGAIISLSALDFLGLGLPAGSASLGEMLSQAKNNADSWWLTLVPFMILALVLMTVMMISSKYTKKA